tara:strand:+ start:42169 stop:42309 length:141 start_codon:yes stop_codon:yes gene_type:complete
LIGDKRMDRRGVGIGITRMIKYESKASFITESKQAVWGFKPAIEYL